MSDDRTPGAELECLSAYGAQVASLLALVSSDIALVIGRDGRITDMAVGSESLDGVVSGWVGRSWANTATADTRRKIEDLLAEVADGAVSRTRQINHRNEAGADVPFSYSAIRLGVGGPVIAVGRDLRAVSAIQQQFVDAQQALERDYWKRRQAELRDRQLLVVASDPVLAVQAGSLEVVAANRAALELFPRPAGVPLTTLFEQILDPIAVGALAGQLRAIQGNARSLAFSLRSALAAGGIELSVSLLGVREDGILRVHASLPPGFADAFARHVGRSPDTARAQQASAVAIVDSSGRLQVADTVFLRLCGVEMPREVQGRPLSELIVEPTDFVRRMLDGATREAVWSCPQAILVDSAGTRVRVDACATMIDDDDQLRIGIDLRRLEPAVRTGEPAAAAVDALNGLLESIGSRSIESLLGEGSALVERALLASALARSEHDIDRAAALLKVDAAWLTQRLQRLDDGVGGPAPHARRLN
ncbi:MAG: hypothetical protein AB7P21_10100 [Lautropia sp.]